MFVIGMYIMERERLLGATSRNFGFALAHRRTAEDKLGFCVKSSRN